MTRYFLIATALAAAGAPYVRAQGRGGGDWSTGEGDAQRSSWVRTDAKISPESIAKPGFEVAWKVKLPNETRQGNAVFAPVLLDRYIGYRGFRSFAFVGGSSDNVFALDTDLGRLEWHKHFHGDATGTGTAACPGGMTAGLTEPAMAAPPSMNDGRGGRAGGRGGPARSGVGAPLEGAVTIAASMAAAANPAGGGRGRGAAIPGAPVPAPRGRMPSMVYALSGDGSFHGMYVSNGDEPEPSVKFLPANANAKGLMLVDNVAYALTVNNCAGVTNGVWALDVASKSVANWSGNAVGAAIGPDGVYVTTADGDLLVLEAKTLAKKSSYSGGAPFTTAPVVFESKGKIMLAAATRDGRLHLVDAATIAGSSMAGTALKAGLNADALSTWQDSTGTRWLLAAGAKSVGAWKVGDTLLPGWTSREIASPLTPVVVNGVVFAVAAGSRSSHAVMYALDGLTGKELWNSGNAIASFAPHFAGLAAGGGQVYLGTNDGTLWAFAFPIEH